MQISVHKKNFQRVLGFVDHLISRNVTLPILNHIVLRTEKGRLQISATNLEVGITAWVGAKIDKEGEIAVPGRLISDFINTINNESIFIAQKNNTLHISSETNKTNILGCDPKEYPIIPKIKSSPVFTLKIPFIREALYSTLDAVATTESRPELAGIHVRFEGKEIVFAATDSFRLAEKKVTGVSNKHYSIIIPRNTAMEILRLTGYLEGEMDIHIDDNQIAFINNDIEIVSRLIDGTYPDYVKVIPEKFISRVLVHREDFEKSIRVASLFSSNTSDVKLLCGQNKITVTAIEATHKPTLQLS
jgi:DNA polymerase III subunit beta